MMKFFVGTSVAVGVLVALMSSVSAARSTNGLEGRRLEKVNDPRSELGDLIGEVLGGGRRPQGAITEVTVIRDDERSLAVRVRYTGFQGGRIWARALDARKRRQRAIESEPVSLRYGSGGTAELVLQLAEETAPPSPFLRLHVASSGGLGRELTETYRLGKNWPEGTPPPAPVTSEVGGDEPDDSSVRTLDPVPVGNTPTGDVDPDEAEDEPDEIEEPTPSRPPIMIPQTPEFWNLLPKVNLFQQASRARWSNGRQALPFGGSASDSRGFVIAHASTVMGDGRTHNNVLQTHPEWKRQGIVFGTLQVQVPANTTRFRTGLGFLRGASGSDGVVFRATCYSGSRRHTLLSERVASSQVVQMDIPLPSDCRNGSVTFVLGVRAGSSAGRDWAAWIAPQLR